MCGQIRGRSNRLALPAPSVDPNRLASRVGCRTEVPEEGQAASLVGHKAAAREREYQRREEAYAEKMDFRVRRLGADASARHWPGNQGGPRQCGKGHGRPEV